MVEAQVESGTTVTFDMEEKGNTKTDQNIPEPSSTTPSDYIFPVYDSGEMQRTGINKAKYDDHTDSYDDYNYYDDTDTGVEVKYDDHKYSYDDYYYYNYDDTDTGVEGNDHFAFPMRPTFDTCENCTCPKETTCKQLDHYLYCDFPPGKKGPKCTIVDPCSERTDDCPEGMKCYGPCYPNVICELARGIPSYTMCLDGWIGYKCHQDIDECTGHTYNDGESKRDKTEDTADTAEDKQSRASPSAVSTAMLMSALVIWLFVRM